MSELNDLDKTNWKEYAPIADSLWMITRDSDPALEKKKSFHGAFVYEIAKNLVLRYTCERAWVLDLFAGSGTAERACKETRRNSVICDIRYKGKGMVISTEGTQHWRRKLDSTKFNAVLSLPPVSLTILHPPYYNIIDFKGPKGDLSGYEPGRLEFMVGIRNAVRTALHYMPKGSHLALVMGDVFYKGRLYPAYDTANTITYSQKDILLLRSIFIKNITGNEHGSAGKQLNLTRYRALTQGWSRFAHEYIFIWRKETY